MRHQRRSRKLNRTASERKALLRGLVTALLQRQRITTTIAKAKEARRLAEKVITIGKDGDLAGQRRLFSILLDRTLVKELVSEIAPRFKGRNGGYTRIIRLSQHRKGDNAEMVILELVEQKVIEPPRKEKKEKKVQPKEPKPEAARKEGAPQEEPRPHREEPPAHPRKEEKKHHVEKPKKGFFHGLQKFLRPPKTTS